MTYPVPSRSSKELLGVATNEYQSQLSGSLGESTLGERGLSPQTISHFRLGTVVSPISGDEMFQGRITIPYLTVSGVVSMRFKRIGEHGSKMMVHPGDKARPYNVGALYERRPLLIVEGEPDVWSAHECGLPAVGIPGANSWTRMWRRVFRNWDVIVVADGDEPGREFATTVAKDLSGAANSCRVVSAPDGEDLGSIYLADGPFGVQGWLGIK